MIPVERIGAAPITWGVCEVPGWGVMLPPERVLGELRSLGITATELGAPGFLPRQPDALTAILAENEISLIGGFVPLVLHEPGERDATMHEARETAELFASCGATMFVTAVVVDAGWSPRFPLSASQWDHLLGMLDELDALCVDHGLTQALHPHVGTLIETADDVSTVIERSGVRWCLDTGHLLIGGYDPARFVADADGRVAHVHLKDVRSAVVPGVASGDVSIRAAVEAGLFRPLGEGDAPIAATVRALERAGYLGWYVLEQDTALGTEAPPVGSGPIEAARASLDFLSGLAVPT